MIQSIRRKFIYEAQGDKGLQKALAFLLLLRSRMGGWNCITSYSRNKVCKLTGCSDGTVKKYIGQLQELGLIFFESQKNGKKALRIKRLSSGTKHRNIRIDGLCFKSFKDAFSSVRCLIHMLRLSIKKFIKQTIRVASKPRRIPSQMKKENFKKAKTYCKSYVNGNLDGSYEYNDYGISYETIAKFMGCCVKTAMKYVKYGLRKRWFTKHNNIEAVFMPGVWWTPIPGYTYTTRNYGVIVHANTYTLSGPWTKKLKDFSALEAKMSLAEYDAYMEEKKRNAEKFRELYLRKQYLKWLEEYRKQPHRVIQPWE